MWGDGHMGGWMWFGWVGGALALVIILWVIIRATQQQGRQEPPQGGQSPEDELKHRYARGEIDRTEFERKLDDLRK